MQIPSSSSLWKSLVRSGWQQDALAGLCVLSPRASSVLSLQTEQTVYWTPCSAQKIKCVKDEHKDPYVPHQCWPFAGKLIIVLEMLLRMVPASGCWFCVQQERKLRGGIRWEVMNSCWNGTQIQNLIVCALSKGSFVLSKIPSPKEVSFVEKTHNALCCGRSAPGCLWGAHSEDSQVKSMQTLSWREEPCFSSSRKKCFELWRNPSVTVRAPAPGSSVLHFPVLHSWDVFSRSASCYPTLSDFLGHQLNMQSIGSLYWFLIWVLDPWKGNLSASKASPEKAMLQSTESHSHT